MDNAKWNFIYSKVYLNDLRYKLTKGCFRDSINSWLPWKKVICHLPLYRNVFHAKKLNYYIVLFKRLFLFVLIAYHI